MKKRLLFFLIAVVIIILCLAFFTLNKNNKEEIPIDNSINSLNESCLKKGNKCSKNEINNGLKLSFNVTDNDTYDFYVLSNDKNNMVLIMNKNIEDDVPWIGDHVKNYYGPFDALHYLTMKTFEWNNIDIIKDYVYSDYGYQMYQDECKDKKESSSCNSIVRGYDKYVIKDGIGTLYYNENLDLADKQTVVNDNKQRSRMITVEELQLLFDDNSKLPNWLIANLKENECYWTLSSSIALNTQINQGAYAVCNVDDNVSIESVLVKNEPNYKMGVRPIITINKS